MKIIDWIFKMLDKFSNSYLGVGILFVFFDILISILIGGPIGELILLHIFMIIPLLAIVLTLILIRILPLPFIIRTRYGKHKALSELEPFRKFDKFKKNMHLKYCQEDAWTLTKELDKIGNEYQEYGGILVNDKLNLDEQEKYLSKVDLKIKSELKILCDKIYTELKENKASDSLKLYCSDDKYLKYKEDLLLYYNNNIKDDFEINDYVTNCFTFIRQYLKLSNLFYNSIYDNINEYNSPIGQLLFSNLNNNYKNELDNCIKNNVQNLGFIDMDKKKLMKNNNILAAPKDYFDIDINDEMETKLNNPYIDICSYYLHNIQNNNIVKEYDAMYYELTNDVEYLLEKLDKDKRIIYAGVNGEETIKKEFDIYKDELKYFSNIRFEDENHSVETDGLILSERGIFSMEIKNYKFPKLIITKDGQWKKCKYNNNGELEEEVSNDVGTQMNRHIIITERLFNEHLKKKKIKDRIEIKPMIVIANDQIEIQNDSDMIVVRASQIYPNLKKSNCNYSKKVLAELEKFIIENKLPPKEYEITNYESTFKKLANFYIDKKERIEDLLNSIFKVLNQELPNVIENFDKEETNA